MQSNNEEKKCIYKPIIVCDKIDPNIIVKEQYKPQYEDIPPFIP